MLLTVINIALAIGIGLFGLVLTSSNANAHRPVDLAVGYAVVGGAAALALATIVGGPRIRLVALAILGVPYVAFALWMAWVFLGKQR